MFKEVQKEIDAEKIFLAPLIVFLKKRGLASLLKGLNIEVFRLEVVMILKHVFDLSSSTRVELGIELSQDLEASVRFVLKNIRNIEIVLTPEIFENYYKNKKIIRKFLENGTKHPEIALDSKTVLRFIEFNGERGVSIRDARFHVSFLDRAAIQLLLLKNSITCLYTDLAIQAEQVPATVNKIVKILSGILKRPCNTDQIAVEDVLNHEKIDKTSQLESDLLAYRFDKIYQRYEKKK